jgi:hypothetical protein
VWSDDLVEPLKSIDAIDVRADLFGSGRVSGHIRS